MALLIHIYNYIRIYILIARIETLTEHFGSWKNYRLLDFYFRHKIDVGVYSYTFHRKNGTYIYSRVNGRIYYFE